MNLLLIFSGCFLGWTALHIVAAERERRVEESAARTALKASRARSKAEEPITVA